MSEPNFKKIAENDDIELWHLERKMNYSKKKTEHLNHVRNKALEKKRVIKLKKNKEHDSKNSKPQVEVEPEVTPNVKRKL